MTSRVTTGTSTEMVTPDSGAFCWGGDWLAGAWGCWDGGGGGGLPCGPAGAWACTIVESSNPKAGSSASLREAELDSGFIRNPQTHFGYDAGREPAVVCPATAEVQITHEAPVAPPGRAKRHVSMEN